MSSFMSADLVVWVQTFWTESSEMTYSDLTDGIFLNKVFKEIDTSAPLETITESVDETKDRLHNWHLFIHNVHAYYTDVLQQVVVMQPPNILSISKDPDSVKAQEEVEKALMLLLGAAVQCERRDHFIREILNKILSETVQSGIMACIKEVTENSRNVVAFAQPSDLSNVGLITQLRAVTTQRDDLYITEIREILGHTESLQEQVATLQGQLQHRIGPVVSSVVVAASGNPEKHHLSVELAESKAKLRRMRTELDEKSEQISELAEEVEALRDQLSRSKDDCQRVAEEARTVRSLRDEADCLRERASQADRLEVENSKMKERLHDAEFYKVRCEELREDLAVIVEEKSVLADKIASDKRLVEAALDMESQLTRAKQEAEKMRQEREKAMDRVCEMAEEVSRLQAYQRSSLEESANLESELERARSESSGSNQPRSLSASLGDQLADSGNSKLLRLEMENRRLVARLDEEVRRVASVEGSGVRVEEVEKENKRLSEKVRALQERISSSADIMRSTAEEKSVIEREREQLKVTMETVRENYDRQLEELSSENEQLNTSLALLRERSEHTSDSRVNNLERDNTRLHQTVQEVSSKLAKLDFEHRQLLKLQTLAQASVERVASLEADLEQSARERSDLERRVTSLQLDCDRLEEVERSLVTVEGEKKRLEVSKERAEADNSSLRGEIARVSESSRKQSSRLTELEVDREGLRCQLTQLEGRLESGVKKKRLEQLEGDLLEMDTENQKLQRQLESTTKRLEAAQSTIQSHDDETSQLTANLEHVKLSLRRHEEASKTRDRLHNDHTSLQTEKSGLERETRRLRQALDAKDRALDDLASQVAEWEPLRMELSNAAESGKEWESRVRELELENRELVQTGSVEKRAQAALREELVNVKIRCQQMVNERDQVNQELERIGLNREKLQMAQDDHTEKKYQALESMMEETVKDAVDKKNERIVALESRLDESKARNLQLSEEIRRMTQELEAIKQRHEEDLESVRSSSAAARGNSGSVVRVTRVMAGGEDPGSPPPSTRDILKLKDRLVELERQNAKLESESSRFSEDSSGLKEEVSRLKSRNSSLDDRGSSLQQKNTDLLGQSASLQVENTALRGQMEGVQAQNSRLQAQYNQLEGELTKVNSQLEEARSSQLRLEQDHEHLTRLHDRLTADYEQLTLEVTRLRAGEKTLQKEVTERKEDVIRLQRDADSVKHLREALEREKDQLQGASHASVTLQEDYARLQTDRSELIAARDHSDTELRRISADYRALRREHGELNTRHDKAQAELAESLEMTTQFDLEVAKLTNRCEALGMLNQKLDDEKRMLLLQLQALLSQNQDLLTQSLENSNHHHEEEISLRDRLTALQQQKERLEVKIMEQYKTYPSSPKKSRSGFGSNFMRKIMMKKRESKEGLKTVGTSDADNNKSGSKLSNSHRSTSMFALNSASERRPKVSSGEPSNSYNSVRRPSANVIRPNSHQRASTPTSNHNSSSRQPPSNRNHSDTEEDRLTQSFGAASTHPGRAQRLIQRRRTFSGAYSKPVVTSSDDSSIQPQMITTKRSVLHVKLKMRGAVSSDDLSQENGERYLDQEDYATSCVESDMTELDFSGPVPHTRYVSQTSTDSSHARLIPGSVSKYDRSPNESDTSDLYDFLKTLHKTKEAEDAKSMDYEAGFSNNWTSGQQRIHQRSSPGSTGRPASAMGQGETASRRQLPTVPLAPARTTSKQSQLGSNNRAMSVPPERMMPRTTSATTISHQPSPSTPAGNAIPPPPQRKTSLPVTDRCEKQMPQSGSVPISTHTPATPLSSARPGSMTAGTHHSSGSTSGATPESASSRIIMNRLTRAGSGITAGLPQRPATAIDFARNTTTSGAGSNGGDMTTRSMGSARTTSVGRVVTPNNGRVALKNGPHDVQRFRSNSGTSGQQDSTSSSPSSTNSSVPGGHITYPNNMTSMSGQRRPAEHQPIPNPPIPRRNQSQVLPGHGGLEESTPSPSSSSGGNPPPPPPRGESATPKKPAVFYEYGNV